MTCHGIYGHEDCIAATPHDVFFDVEIVTRHPGIGGAD